MASLFSARVKPLALVAVTAFVIVPVAVADTASETALAEKYAPVVRLVDQPEECGPGEPYIPTDVDVLFNEPTVAFRGPWSRTDLVMIGPAASDLVNRYEYHLDYPGDPLDAGCDNTVGPHRELLPVVKTIPSDPAAAESAFPWIAFEGRWGELQAAFFNGPTGPNMKGQWTHPIEWSRDWRGRPSCSGCCSG